MANRLLDEMRNLMRRRHYSIHTGGEINADRARRQPRMPVVLTHEETARVVALISGVHQLIVKLLYGSGLRITECLRLRVQDVDLEMKAPTVRNGKGDKDRITTFPEMLVQPQKEHLDGVMSPLDDLAIGC